jgi:hypothetical protein
VDAVSEVNKEPEPVVTEVPKEAVPETIKENQQSETCKESEIDIEGDATNDAIPETAEEPDIIIVEDAAPKDENKVQDVSQDIPEPIIIDEDPDDTANSHPKRPIDAIDIKEEPTHKRSRLESESPAMSSSPHPDDDSAVSTPARHSKDDIRQKTWQKTIILLWQEIANHKNGTMFMNPIKKSNAPLYYQVVKQPLDLKSIKNRVRDGVNISNDIAKKKRRKLTFIIDCKNNS